MYASSYRTSVEVGVTVLGGAGQGVLWFQYRDIQLDDDGNGAERKCGPETLVV